MKILGIHDGHTATACYLEDGKIISALSEERLTRKKGHGGFPSAALRHILEQENLSPDDIDIVALVGFLKPLTSTDQYQEGRQKYFPKLIRMFPGDPGRIINFVVSRGKKHRLRDNNLVRCLQDAGLPLHKVRLVEHHQAHAATAWYLSPFYQQGQPALVITLDGSGDGLSGTVSLVDAQGKWSRLQNISSFDSYF
jgi:carbamoyltransferase